MSIRRLPILLGGIAASVSLVMVLAVRFGPRGVSDRLLQVSMADSPSWWMADRALDLIFDRRGIGPSPTQEIVFEVALVVAAFVEWYVVGWVVRFVLQRRR